MQPALGKLASGISLCCGQVLRLMLLLTLGSGSMGKTAGADGAITDLGILPRAAVRNVPGMDSKQAHKSPLEGPQADLHTTSIQYINAANKPGRAVLAEGSSMPRTAVGVDGRCSHLCTLLLAGRAAAAASALCNCS